MLRYVVAAWADVFAKAKRMKDEGRVIVQRNGYDNVVAMVRGAYGVYEVEFNRQDPDSRAISMWSCTCPWAQFVWFRTGPWKKYEGRVCSHTLAAYWAAKGTPLDEDAQEQYDEQDDLGQMAPTPTPLDGTLPGDEEGPPGGPGAEMLNGPEDDMPDEMTQPMPEQLPIDPSDAQNPGLPQAPELPFKPQTQSEDPNSPQLAQPNPIEQSMLELQKHLGPDTMQFFKQKYPNFFKVPGTLSSVHTAATRMVPLDRENDDWAIYSDVRRGPYDTPLVFRGTFDECRAWVREHGHTAGVEDFEMILKMLRPGPGKNMQTPTGLMLKPELGEMRGGVNPHPDAMPASARRDGTPLYHLEDMGWHPQESVMYTQDRAHLTPERRGDYGEIPQGAHVTILDADPTTKWLLVDYPLPGDGGAALNYVQHRRIESWVEASAVKLIGNESMRPDINRRVPPTPDQQWSPETASDDWA